MKKSELNQNISITDRNNKSVSTDDIYFLTWNIPSIVTCPYATEMCKKKMFCY